jgi:beta-galactosidase
MFDGAMAEPTIYVNGKEAGHWAYGYNAFRVDITPLMKTGDNLLEVSLKNVEESSRWYPGAGLYRNVHLIVTDALAVKLWGTYVTTPVIRDTFAKVNIQVELDVPQGMNPEDIAITTAIIGDEGTPISHATGQLSPFDEGVKSMEHIVPHPRLWSPDTPHLYKAVTTVCHRGDTTDIYETPFGIRDIAIVPDQGFFLNGQRTLFRGTCSHHDNGPLGAVANATAVRRKVRLLKDMGSNAYRTSHNMPEPELIQACNEMGMMVMAESFDEWQCAKMKNGYHRHFQEWVERDITNLVRRYRNRAD